MIKDHKQTIIICSIIFVLALIPRIITAIKMGWLAEDVFFVDFINNWFLEHFRAYFFQFQHNFFPPRSPEFGSPPLALWLETFGMWISNKLGFSLLIGARMINVIFGALTCSLAYIFGKKWFNKKTGIFASIILAISPTIIAINSSAHIDTILAFFMLLSIYVFFNYIHTKNKKMLFLLGILLGLSLLIKIYAIVLIILIIIYIIFDLFIKKNDDENHSNKKKNFKIFLIFLLIIILIPPLLWAGARDIDHIHRTINRVTDVGGLSFGVGYGGVYSEMEGISGYQDKSWSYNIFMLFGRMLPIISVIFIPAIILLTCLGVLQFIRRKILSDSYSKSLFLILVCVLGILAIQFFGGPKGVSNRIIFIMILITIISSYVIVKIITFLSERIKKINDQSKIILKIFLIVFLLTISAIPMLTWSPNYYNAYNNFLVGGVEGGSSLYRVGHGEGLEEASKWIMDNTQDYAFICAPRIGFIDKYLTKRVMVYCPLNSNLKSVYSHGAEYIILHNSFMSGGLKPPIVDDLANISPVHTIEVKGYPYILIYKLPQTGVESTRSTKLSLLPNDWITNTKTNSSSILLGYNDETLELEYTLESGDYVYMLNEINIENNQYDVVSINISGDGKNENFYLDIGERNKGYARYKTKVNWEGWKRFDISLDTMEKNLDDINLRNINYVKLSLDSEERTEGTLKIKEIRLYNQES